MNFRRPLILCHRYLGIAIGLMFVIWFASGIVMIYVGEMPRLDDEARLEHLPALDLSKVRLSPAAAAERLATAGRMTLLSVLERPAYRIRGRQSQTLFADNGEVLEDIDREAARVVAGRFAGQPPERVEFVRTLDRPDQWTLSLRAALPVHKFRLQDAAATEIYVSPHSAEVVLLTTRSERALAWMGAIPHWIYFTALRTNQPLWSSVVVWLSGLGCVLAVLGLILAFTQFRRVRPFRLSEAIAYRGWMRWHYILGAVFGLFALTWVFSGLLSMEPFAWTNAAGLDMRRDVLTGGPVELSSFGTLDAAAFKRLAAGRAIRQIDFIRIQDEQYYAVSTAEETPAGTVRAQRLLIPARTMTVRRDPFSVESILTRLAAAAPDARIVESLLLSGYDSYYYSRDGQAPLPVLRVKFDDPAQTWFYVDPRTSEIVRAVHRFSRLERWLYNGLHSLDFRFWYGKRPLWDIGMILLLLGGLALSGIGLYLGVKRLISDLKAATAAGKNTVRAG